MKSIIQKLKLKKATEKNLERKLRLAVIAIGGLCLKLLPISFRGFPDRTMLLPGGRIIFVEIKSEGYNKNTPTVKQQGVVRRLLEGLGFRYYLIDTEAALQEFIATEL